MNNQAAFHFGRALFVPLILLSGAVAAGPVAVLPPAAVAPPAVSAAALPARSTTASLPAMPAGAGVSSPAASTDAMSSQSAATLPGLDGLADNQSKDSAAAVSGTKAIRPIRLPNVPSPIGTGS